MVIDVGQFTRRRWSSPGCVEIAYVIAGRKRDFPSVPVLLKLLRKHLSFSLRLLSWDDVVDRLSGQGEEKTEPEFTVILIEIVGFSRRLLRKLVSQPELLTGIDDRKFEELVATLLFDLGLKDVVLTPPRQDGGRDIILTHIQEDTGDRHTYLVECKHWVSGNKVTLRWALSLLEVARSENARGAVLLSSSPKISAIRIINHSWPTRFKNNYR